MSSTNHLHPDRNDTRPDGAVERLAAIMKGSNDAITAATLDGVITDWNLAAERLYGYPAQDVIGQPISILFVSDGQQAMLEQILARVAAGGAVENLETRGRTPDGRVFEVSLTVSPIPDAAGRVVGVSAIGRDLAERNRAAQAQLRVEDELRRSQRLLTDAERLAHVGSWEMALPGGELTCSDEMYRILGREPQASVIGSEGFVDQVHPEDRARFVDEFRTTIWSAEPSRTTIRIVRPDGEVRHVEGIAAASAFVDGRASRIHGSVHDVTDQHRTVRALTEAEELFRSAFEHAPSGMMVVALDGTFVRVNEAMCQILGRPFDELVGRKLFEFTHPDNLAADRAAARAMAAGERSSFTEEKRYLHADGHTVHAEICATVMHHPDGRPAFWLTQVQDVTDRKRHEKELHFQAEHDIVTGLLNRRGFSRALETQTGLVGRYGPVGSILVLDLDHFKYVNDTLGHHAGDQLIVSVATTLSGRLRS